MSNFSFSFLYVPFGALLFLTAFSVTLFIWQAMSTAEKGRDTTAHSDRIYKDFEMYLKVTLLLVGGLGYVRLERYEAIPNTAREAMHLIGAISMFVMVLFSIFVVCHQGSKIRRWENIEWPKAIFWQETWAVFGMWIFSSAIWVVSYAW